MTKHAPATCKQLFNICLALLLALTLGHNASLFAKSKPAQPVKTRIEVDGEQSKSEQTEERQETSPSHAVRTKKVSVTPTLSLQGNMANYNTLQLATIAAANHANQHATLLEERPLLITVQDEKTYQRLWNLFNSSILSDTPVHKPKLDFSTEGALFVVPYKSRGGGKPPTLRGIQFDSKKKHLVIEFDESDLFNNSEATSKQSITSVMGNPWYFAVFPNAYLETNPIVRVRDW